MNPEMKIALYDPSGLSYTVSTPYQESLPAAKALFCYVGEALAQQGHQVVLLNTTKEPCVDRGVICLLYEGINQTFFSSVDIVIILNRLEAGEEFAKILDTSTRLALLLCGDLNSDRYFQAMSEPGILESFDAIFFTEKQQQKYFYKQFSQGYLKTYLISNNNWQNFSYNWVQNLQEILASKWPYQTAYRYFLKQNYQRALPEYEQAIEKKPNVPENYWYYGLCLLMQEREEEAQSAWFYPFLKFNVEDENILSAGLLARLEKEALKFERLQKDSIAWVLRQHIRELNPTHVENAISLIRLSIKLISLNEHEYLIDNFAKIVKSGKLPKNQFNESIQILFDFLKSNPPEHLADCLIDAYQTFCQKSQSFKEVFIKKYKINFYQTDFPIIASIKIAQLGLFLQNDSFSLWTELSSGFYGVERYREGVNAAQNMIKTARTKIEEIVGYYQLINGMLNSNVCKRDRVLQIHENIYLKAIDDFLKEEYPWDIETLNYANNNFQMIVATGYFPYLYDNPKKTHSWRRKIGYFWQRQWQKYADQYLETNSNCSVNERQHKNKKKNKLKVGYISSSLRRHSVGYLSQWLFQEYNRQHFEFYIYSLFNTKDSLAIFFEENSYFRGFTDEEKLDRIAKEIQDDNIDILIDLDGLTKQTVSRIMLMKPAPIQATWLGFDASGIPAIDYFIADPYVLPENAQKYYNETIWRLPQTYIAVGGFDVGSPSLRREDLGIPKDAVIYFSSQSGPKRNLDNIRMQMRILREVPGSYFITKTTSGDQESIQAFFTEIAAKEGVGKDRLRFLPKTPSPETHRANIAIADVVLDTYPYNGATTTMETLWMEVPIVTRVGEQFAARNSYAMMVNAGIEEGIAWTDEEYVEWGIRLGKEPQLRQEVSWKLKQSKKSAPLWNAKQFTRDMEAAYQQMWQKYIDGLSQ